MKTTTQVRHQLPCRPGVGIESQIYEIQHEMGISTTGVVTYLLKLGIELHNIRAAEDTRLYGRLSQAEFFQKALPYLGGR